MVRSHWVVALVLATVATIAVYTHVSGALETPPRGDLSVYWEAAARMRAGGDDLYDPPRDASSHYIYPPAFAALIAPLSLGSRLSGYLLWMGFNLALIPVAGLALWGALGARDSAERGDIALAAVVATSGALLDNACSGQPNVWVTATVLLGLWATESGRPGVGGALCALAAHLKVTPVVLIAVFVVQRRWRVATGWSIGFLAALLLPLIWMVPVKGFVPAATSLWNLGYTYVERVARPRFPAAEAHELGGFRVPNNSLSATVHRLFGRGTAVSFASDRKGPLLFRVATRKLRWVGPAIAAGLLGGALFLAHRKRFDRRARIATAGLALLAADLGVPLSWPHHLTILAILAGALASDRRYRTPLRIFLAACLGLVYLPMLDPTETLHAYGIPTLGILIAWGTAFTAFARASPRCGVTPTPETQSR